LRIAAQRAAGDEFLAALNEQLRPSALRAALPAAKAALVALMQNISRAAAAISMVNLMARSFPKFALPDVSRFHHSTNGFAAQAARIGPVLA
jgi:ABC-type arginine/histidine transport system permease subunit